MESKLLSLVNEILGQTAKLRKGGTEAVYFCPVCNHYKRKLNINLSTGAYQCWVCHFRGSYLGSLLSKLKAPKHYRDQLFELTKDVRLQRKNKTKVEDQTLQLPRDFISLAVPNDSIEYRHAMSYLKNRGITMTDICRYNIGYSPWEYKDCIVVPSYDDDGKLNYYSCRYFYPYKIKYRNAPASKNIVGFESFVNYDEPVTLVEGAFDAIAVRNNGIPLFGTFISMKLKEQLIIHKTKRVNILLDPDALKEATAAVEELWKWGITVHLIQIDKDPDELGFETVHHIIEQSKPFNFKDLVYAKLME